MNLNFLKFKKNNPEGFTLVEMLLAVSLITILSGIAIPLYQSFQVKNDIDIAAVTIAQTLKRAQILSRSMAENSMWGVKVQNGSIVIFKGVSFSVRDQIFDEVYEISPGISISGNGTIISGAEAEDVFSKMTGESQQTGTITLTSANGEIKNITVNSKGMAEY